jgi:VanZ family protein
MLPSDSMPVQVVSRLPVSDKALHFFAYAVLAFLPVLYERLRTALVVAVCLAVIGVLVEVGQSYTGSRSFEMKDIAANGIGVLFGLMAGLPYRAGRRKVTLRSAAYKEKPGSLERSRRRAEG